MQSNPSRNRHAETYHGKPCRICGGTERYVSNKSCFKCAANRSVAVWASKRKKGPGVAELVDSKLDAIDIEKTPAVTGHMGRNLAYAMIRQAVEDYWADVQEVIDDAARGTLSETAFYSAFLWITGSEPKPLLSFEFCCEVFDIDPDRLRERILLGDVKSLPELPAEVVEGHEHFVERAAPDFVQHD